MKRPGAREYERLHLTERTATLHLLYAIASYLLFLLALPVILLHTKVRQGQARRMGFYPETFLADRPKRPGAPRVWLHGASAGDLSALSPMIREIKARLPGATVVVSCFTNSGAMMAPRLEGVDAVTYVPWDLPGATRRAMRAIDPDLLVLEYTELWPNLIRAARRHGARIALTNGRFAPQNVPRYRALFRLAGDFHHDLDLWLMREEEEAERALGLGAPIDRVWVTGNTKFDALVPEAQRTVDGLAEGLGLRPGEPVLIAGSTHEGEEGTVLEVYRRLRASFPALRLVIAPRYLERVPRVRALVQDAGLPVRLRSDAPPAGAEGEARPVVLLDTIGELVAAYRLATLVFVGGSFTSRGGQNILEPAAQGRPVLFGPNMANFRDSVQILVGRGGIQVHDPEQFHDVARDLLERPERARSLGGLAERTVGAIRGASARNVEHMLRLLDRSDDGGAAA